MSELKACAKHGRRRVSNIGSSRKELVKGVLDNFFENSAKMFSYVEDNGGEIRVGTTTLGIEDDKLVIRSPKYGTVVFEKK